MSKNNTILKGLVIGLITGIVIAYAGLKLFNPSESEQVEEKKDKEPLYWVAPMDPNYRRDQPGQSPMGMDLIPFYGDGGGFDDSGPGTISISPTVVNNLGVRTETVKKRSLNAEIKTVGYVQYDADLLINIHPRVEGWVEQLYIKAAGNPVSKGQALYEIYAPELVNAQEEYLLALERNNQGLITAAQNRLKSLQISSEQIQQVKTSRKVKQNVTFYAPQSGVVDALIISEGSYVKPGNALMTIASLNDVWVEAEVFERQAHLLTLNQQVTMTLDFLPGREWQGTVDYIYPTLNPQTRTLKVRLKFNNDDLELKPNMYAQVALHSGGADNVLAVSTEAVIRTGNSNRVVLALGDGQFKSVNVKVGRFYEEYVEVLAGLEAGDKVVTSAQFLLDSESSKTSDFKRMNSDTAAPQSVWVEARINSVMADHNMLNATHEPIDAWDWPEMTMDFTVADDVDISPLSPGMIAHVQIEKTDNQFYRVTDIHIPKEASNEKTTDHSGHDMNNHDAEEKSMKISDSEMSTMDHSGHDMNKAMSEQKTEEQPNTKATDTNNHEIMDHSQHQNHDMKGDGHD